MSNRPAVVMALDSEEELHPFELQAFAITVYEELGIRMPKTGLLDRLTYTLWLVSEKVPKSIRLEVEAPCALTRIS